MRVGIDATELLNPIKTGIQRYATSLILSISEALPETLDLDLYLYFHSGDRHAEISLLSELRSKLGRARIRRWRVSRGYRLALPMLAAADRLDLLHLPAPNYLRFYPCKVVMTVHDLCWIRLPSEVTTGEFAADGSVMERALKHTFSWIAVSRNTRDDLVSGYRADPDSVRVIYEGVDSSYRPSKDAAKQARRRYGLDRYVLYVGTLQSRKNLPRLIEAYASLVARHTISHKLVLAGSEGWGSREVFATAERVGLNGQVVFLGYVPNEDLPGLYAGADLFIYPSLYEGFGLPVLEAMACGTPVALAHTSALPEIAAAAGVYFDPLSIDDISKVMHKALSNPTLRRSLRQQGLERAKEFSWRKTASETLSVYRTLRDP